DGGDPTDLARATTTYHLNVEGTLARGGYFAKNQMMQEAPLRLLNKGFQFISTDEGRHITFGLELLKELLEKERAGEPEYQGVSEVIWDQMNTDLDDIVNTAYFITDDVGDPLEVGLDDIILRGANLLYTMYVEELGIEDKELTDISNAAFESLEKAKSFDYDTIIENHSHIYSQKEKAQSGA
ncbi:MAG: ribonucleotide-diphosphate reductase subunit beta, partial [Halobacteria archaeon]|nr:ribonucleotide-diphosphate reductase subunit beta [Halobacteria archaeon]